LKKPIYAGLFLVTLGTLMYEILLPRIFSVTMFYHFAFMAVSLAMFGMTVGAVIVYLKKERYTEASAPRDMALNALGFALTSVLCLFVYLQIPILESSESQALPMIAVAYVLIAVPFVFSGITVAIALTRFPAFVGRLYAVDLLGAATGAVVIVVTLEHTDALTSSIVTAALIASGAAAFALATSSRNLRAGLTACAVLIAGMSVGHHFLAERGKPVLRIVHRAFPQIPRLYERWNSFSFVEVLPSFAPSSGQALGWGVSSTIPPDLQVNQLSMDIDIKAGTPITAFNGDPKQLTFLRYDVTNAVHQVKRDADVCVIGVGGGRDVLSALHFQQRSVLGIELNANVLGAVTGPFGEFSGHLDRHPGVELVVDEARSFMARTDKRCDIVQISLIDTFAATAAGAFVLAENSLYTVEAWDLFLRRLTADGVLSVSRYYYHQRPAEAYRMLSLAVAALEKNGVSDYRRHLVLIKNQSSLMAGAAGIGTLLVSRSPWTEPDLDRLARYARRMKFEIVLSPRSAGGAVLERIASGRDLPAFYARYEVDVSPPSDDRPFFFQMLRLRDVLSFDRYDEADVNWKNLKAILVLAVLLAIVAVLTVLCIVVPIARTRDRSSIRAGASLLFFFGAIGLGFMFIEMAQMQRLMVFLGHPTYALSVVLFTLLLASGAGSYVAQGLMERYPIRSLGGVFVALLLVVALVGLASPALMSHFAHAQSAGRIALAIAILVPLGLAMGMPFPIGMRRAGELAPALSPWLWGINGATSVCASVLAIAVALSLGISASYWIGTACYLAAGAIFVFWASGRERGAGEPGDALEGT
jgi:hypothetical protein